MQPKKRPAFPATEWFKPALRLETIPIVDCKIRQAVDPANLLLNMQKFRMSEWPLTLLR